MQDSSFEVIEISDDKSALWVLACPPFALIGWQAMDTIDPCFHLAQFVILQFLGLSWGLVLVFVGRRHRTPWGRIRDRRAAYSLFLPFLVFCSLAATGAIVIGRQPYSGELLWGAVGVTILIVVGGLLALLKWPRKAISRV